MHYIEQNREPFLADAPMVAVNTGYPYTLDMRQFWKKK